MKLDTALYLNEKRHKHTYTLRHRYNRYATMPSLPPSATSHPQPPISYPNVAINVLYPPPHWCRTPSSSAADKFINHHLNRNCVRTAHLFPTKPLVAMGTVTTMATTIASLVTIKLTGAARSSCPTGPTRRGPRPLPI